MPVSGFDGVITRTDLQDVIQSLIAIQIGFKFDKILPLFGVRALPVLPSPSV